MIMSICQQLSCQMCFQNLGQNYNILTIFVGVLYYNPEMKFLKPLRPSVNVHIVPILIFIFQVSFEISLSCARIVPRDMSLVPYRQLSPLCDPLQKKARK